MADPLEMNESACGSFLVAFIIYHVRVLVCCRLGPLIVLQMQKKCDHSTVSLGRRSSVVE